jgi:nitroreductase
MDLIEALRTTGAVREFDGTPVPDDVLYRVLDTARFAPNGGNRQAWRVVVVQDPAIRAAVRDLYLLHWYDYLAMAAAGLTPFAPVHDPDAEAAAVARVDEVRAQAAASSRAFAEHVDDVPVLLALLADLRSLAAMDRGFDRYTLIGGASIYPFAWSILLAAHAEGLGGVLTTVAIREEGAIEALLGAPPELCVAGVMALGYPTRRATRLRRRPVESFATIDAVDGPVFTTPPSTALPSTALSSEASGAE